MRKQPHEVRGFMVNMTWVRASYFPEITAQISRIMQGAHDIELAILDERERLVAGRRTSPRGPFSQRVFPVLFFDPIIVSVSAPRDLRQDSWTIEASASDDALLGASDVGANRASVIGTVTMVLIGIAFALTMHGVRANADLAATRANFVSSVNHELKSPIAMISAISETFATGRVTPELSRQYGPWAFNEARRFARLIDTLLAYARIADVTEAYVFESLDPRLLIDETLRDFVSQLEHDNVTMDLDVPSGLPAVRADRRAMRLVLGNLLDNAIRYSHDTRHIHTTSRATGKDVTFEVADHGIGIAPDELPNKATRLFRGTRGGRGSGLGLAIVDRIVQDHGDRLTVRSTLHSGTTVSFILPASANVPA